MVFIFIFIIVIMNIIINYYHKIVYHTPDFYALSTLHPIYITLSQAHEVVYLL